MIPCSDSLEGYHTVGGDKKMNLKIKYLRYFFSHSGKRSKNHFIGKLEGLVYECEPSLMRHSINLLGYFFPIELGSFEIVESQYNFRSGAIRHNRNMGPFRCNIKLVSDGCQEGFHSDPVPATNASGRIHYKGNIDLGFTLLNCKRS